MRILILTQQLAAFRSGVGTYAFHLISGLQAAEHQVTVVAPDQEMHDISGARFLGIPTSALDPTPGRWISLGARFARVLTAEASRHDIAHFTDAREGFAMDRYKIPVTAMVNDSYALDWLDSTYPRALFADRLSRALYYGLLRFTERRTYRKFTHLVTNSRHVRDAIVPGYRLDPRRVQVIHYGLNVHEPAPSPALAGSPSILFVGGNFVRKGLPTLLDAIARLKPKFARIHVHVVGRDRNQPILEEQARRLDIVDCVSFHGWQPNETVHRMMAGSDMFALPSLTEGFGLVYLEAMHAGAPVIATRLGGAHEVFVENTEAAFVAPGSVAELSAAIEKIASDRNFAEALCEGGRKAASRFTVGSMVEQTETLWKSILSQ